MKTKLITSLLLALLISSLALAACGGDDDDDNPDAAFCSDLESLQTAIEGLRTTLSNPTSVTMDQLQSDRTDISESWDAVVASGSDVAQSRIDDLRTAFDNLINSLTSVTSAGSISGAITSIQDAANTFTDEVESVFSSLDCESSS